MLAGAASLFSIIAASGQVGNALSPITFTGGNSINTATINAASNSGNSDPLIDNSVAVLGTGGSLTGSSQLTFINGFSGTGVLTLNVSAFNWIEFGYGYYDSVNSASFPNGFAFQSGEAEFQYRTSILNGPVSVTGSCTVSGTVVIAGNSVSGAAGTTLNIQNGALTFLGSGFTFNSAFNGATLANPTGTQSFGGLISGNILRVGAGSSVITSSVNGVISAYGGTLTLSGNGVVSPSFGYAAGLAGGSLVLDNTTTNNNARVNGTVYYQGGNLTILGLSGGATNATLAAPEFSLGLNVIDLAAGAGAGSSAVLTYSGTGTRTSTDTGCVDFQGLGTASQVFITGKAAGPMGAWATVAGADFANYSTTAGVQTLPPDGRPSQVSAGTSSSYVLGTGPQNALTGNITVTGVTMNSATTLGLGGNTLTLAGWIQNGGTGTISTGTLASAFPYSMYITTNTDLSLQMGLSTSTLAKNGAGTLTCEGAFAEVNNNLCQYYVNAGTLALNANTPLQSLQGQFKFIVGQSAGTPGSATLSLAKDNQFIATGAPASFVGIEVQPAGQLKLNGHNANLSFLQINSGTADLGGATLTANTITANAVATTGQITNGTLVLATANNPYGGLGAVGFTAANQTYQDSLLVTAKVVSTSSVNITGPGTVVLGNAANSFGSGTVGLTLTSGILAVQNSGAVGSTNQQILFNGGALRADSTGTLTLTNPIAGSNGVITSGSDIVFAGGFTQTVYGSGFAPADTLTVVGYSNNGQNYYSSNSGPGTLVLSGSATGSTTGAFSQNAGTLAFDSDLPLPVTMPLKYLGGVIEAVNNPHTISNTLTISSDITFAGSQPLTFGAASGNNIDPNSGLVTRYFYVDGTGPVTINSLSNTESDSLVAAGTGTLVLSGAPTGFTATQANGGTLRIKNTGTASASLGTVTVNAAGTFGGTGNVTGATTVASGGMLDPGDQPGAIGALVFKSSLTLNSGAMLDMDLGAPGLSDLVTVTGSLAKSGTTGSTYPVYFNQVAGFTGTGTYSLITFGSTTFLASDFSSPGPVKGAFQFSGKTLQFVVTGVVPAVTSAPPSVAGVAGSTYTFTFTASGYPAPAFTLYSGALPPGLTLSSTGVLSGVPAQAGTFSGVIEVSNSVGTAFQTFTITIQDTPKDTPTLPQWGLALLAALLASIGLRAVPGQRRFAD